MTEFIQHLKKVKIENTVFNLIFNFPDIYTYLHIYYFSSV